MNHLERILLEELIGVLRRVEKLLERILQKAPLTVSSIHFVAQGAYNSSDMSNPILDTNPTYFFPLATMSDGSVSLFPASQYTLAGDVATPAVTTLPADFTVAGLTAPVPAGTSVWSIPPTNAAENVNLTASGINDASGNPLVYTDGTTATPITFTVAEAAAPVTVSSLSFVAQQS